MNSIEEKLWNYIDGGGSPEEQAAIAGLIASDEHVRLKYRELLALNSEFSAIELDEPPMAFTYNVIEAIRTSQAQVPLKSAINKRIIMGITIFFVLTLTAFLTYAFVNMDWTVRGVPDVAANIPGGLRLPQVSAQISKPVIEGFMFFDVVLALFLSDNWLRRKKLT